jgi:hypothetical protein
MAKKKHAAFHREVGELVFWFAAAENTVYIIALELLGGRKIAEAVLPNFHLDRAVELVRKLARCTKSRLTWPNSTKHSSSSRHAHRSETNSFTP